MPPRHEDSGVGLARHPRYRQRPPPVYFLPSPLENITSLLPSFGTPKSSTSSLPLPSSSSSSGSSKRRSQIDELLKDPVAVGVLSAVAALGIAGGGWYSYRTLWRRIRNVNDVTGAMLDKQKWIRGVVTSVGDGGESIAACWTSRSLLDRCLLDVKGPARDGMLISLRQLSSIPYTWTVLPLASEASLSTNSSER